MEKIISKMRQRGDAKTVNRLLAENGPLDTREQELVVNYFSASSNSWNRATRIVVAVLFVVAAVFFLRCALVSEEFGLDFSSGFADDVKDWRIGVAHCVSALIMFTSAFSVAMHRPGITRPLGWRSPLIIGMVPAMAVGFFWVMHIPNQSEESFLHKGRVWIVAMWVPIIQLLPIVVTLNMDDTYKDLKRLGKSVYLHETP